MTSNRQRKRRHRIYLIRERAKHPLMPPALSWRRWRNTPATDTSKLTQDMPF